MRVIIAYDIGDDVLRGTLYKFLTRLGIQVQRSVFECDLSHERIGRLRREVSAMLGDEGDSVLIYPVCRRCVRHAVTLGRGAGLVSGDWDVI